jgi:hypothetical protein
MIIAATAVLLCQSSVCWFAPESELTQDANWKVRPKEQQISLSFRESGVSNIHVTVSLMSSNWAAEGQLMNPNWTYRATGPSGWQLSSSTEWRERTSTEYLAVSARAVVLNHKVVAQSLIPHGAPSDEIKADIEGYVRGVVAIVNSRQTKEATRTMFEGKSISSFTVAGGDCPLVELEAAATAIGATVEANRRTYLFTVTKGDQKLTIAMGSGQYELKGQPRKETLSTSFIEGGKAYVPLTALQALK